MMLCCITIIHFIHTVYVQYLSRNIIYPQPYRGPSVHIFFQNVSLHQIQPISFLHFRIYILLKWPNHLLLFIERIASLEMNKMNYCYKTQHYAAFQLEFPFHLFCFRIHRHYPYMRTDDQAPRYDIHDNFVFKRE